MRSCRVGWLRLWIHLDLQVCVCVCVYVCVCICVYTRTCTNASSHVFSLSPINSSFSDLARLHTLLGQVSAHAALRARFVAHIKATGLPLVQVVAWKCVTLAQWKCVTLAQTEA